MYNRSIGYNCHKGASVGSPKPSIDREPLRV
jgi:hypothetical protein